MTLSKFHGTVPVETFFRINIHRAKKRSFVARTLLFPVEIGPKRVFGCKRLPISGTKSADFYLIVHFDIIRH